ncbi:MAG: DNA polymerase IV [Clostridia bacterium]|nr:DNA polymerase IV [Clostridia bacterium]
MEKNRQILHVDVNNAFLSWTAVNMLKNGAKIDIRTIPSIIGGDEERRAGIVLAKSPIAKKFGVVTGEPIYFAKQKCNRLEIYPCDFQVYKKYSNDLYNLLLEYTDKIERFSIDECFMDLTGYLMKRDLLDIAKEINTRVEKELGFTVNVGVAHNKLLAKMASDFEKPNKVHTLFEDEIKNKMWNLPVAELFMLGKKTVPKLFNMQIKTIGDLANTDAALLEKRFGKHGRMMWEYSNGIDNSEVNNKIEPPKSIGNSVTLPKNLNTIEEINEILIMLADQVSFRLRKHDLIANTINVQLRTKDFLDFSKQTKLPFPTANTKEIINISKQILKTMYNGESIRLVGLRADNLEDKSEQQISFFNNEKQDKLDKAIDILKDKYGFNKIKRAGDLFNARMGDFNRPLR